MLQKVLKQELCSLNHDIKYDQVMQPIIPTVVWHMHEHHSIPQ